MHVAKYHCKAVVASELTLRNIALESSIVMAKLAFSKSADMPTKEDVGIPVHPAAVPVQWDDMPPVCCIHRKQRPVQWDGRQKKFE